MLLTLIGITAIFLLLSFSLKINGTYRFGFLVFICYVVLFSAVSLCLLWGFKDTDVIFIEGEAGEDEHSPDRIMLDGRERRYVDVSERWNLLMHVRFLLRRICPGKKEFVGHAHAFAIGDCSCMCGSCFAGTT